MDCPEDVNQYIHRAGRTARHNAKGESLLVLLPSEEDGMMDDLNEKNITINRIHIDPKKLFSPKAKIEAFLAQDQQLKDSAQRAFISYIKSVFVMKNKNIFKVKELDLDAFSKSLGLVSLPRIRFIDRLRYMRAKPETTKQLSEGEEASEEEDSSNEDSDPSNEDSDSSNEDSDSSNEVSDSSSKNIPSQVENHSKYESKSDAVDFNLTSDSEEEDLLKIVRVNHEIDQDASSIPEEKEVAAKSKVLTKAAIAKRVLKKNIVANQKMVFNEEGQVVKDKQKELQSELGREYMNQDVDGIDIEMAKKVLREEDKFDRKRHQELVKSRKNLTKLKQKEHSSHNDFESDSDNDVDLSWLPDPDKIYTKPSSDNSLESNESDEDDDDEIHRLPSKLFVQKNKRKNSLEQVSCNKKSKSITLNEAENIAMQLLQ